jgi:uncharacterized protein (DUF1786 family)
MSRFLLIDVGAGTMDILFWDDHSDLHYKAVVKSPVQHLAEQAAALPGNLVVTGCEMGGGAISNVLRQRAQEFEVVMSVSAAATIHHDLDKVSASGIHVVDDKQADKLGTDQKYHNLTLGDLPMERIRDIVEGFGVSFSFDIAGVCVQDHGVPAPGMSHLDFRHSLFKVALDENPFPHALLYPADQVPTTLSRLTAVAATAKKIPADDVYVMDSGMAAILGSSMDASASLKQNILVIDAATSHTLGAALMGHEIAGFFEYHTRDITLGRLEQLIRALADGKMDHRQIVEEGGHGAYIRKAFGFEAAEVIIVTGPKRYLLKDSRLSTVWGAPLGDNMMTGTAGLLEAIRRRKMGWV